MLIVCVLFTMVALRLFWVLIGHCWLRFADYAYFNSVGVFLLFDFVCYGCFVTVVFWLVLFVVFCLFVRLLVCCF